MTLTYKQFYRNLKSIEFKRGLKIVIQHDANLHSTTDVIFDLLCKNKTVQLFRIKSSSLCYDIVLCGLQNDIIETLIQHKQKCDIKLQKAKLCLEQKQMAVSYWIDLILHNNRSYQPWVN